MQIDDSFYFSLLFLMNQKCVRLFIELLLHVCRFLLLNHK